MSEADIRSKFVAKLKRYAKKTVKASEAVQFDHFIYNYYKNVALDDLEGREVTKLFGAAYSHWQLILQRLPQTHKVNVFNPNLKENGWDSTHTVIEVILEDMPFLVDSMRMVLTQMKINTHLTIHLGGLRIKRNKKGALTEVLTNGRHGTTFISEAPIYMEIDRQTDPKVLSTIESNLRRTLQDVQIAVNDWGGMREELYNAIENIDSVRDKLDLDEVEETKAFLNWLAEDHFTFLGCRRYKLATEKKEKVLNIIPKSGLGVLRDEKLSKHSRHFSDLPEEARKTELSKQILIISQTNTQSTVHRPAFTVCIIVKSYHPATGKREGEWRFIGLYTSDAYNTNPKDIPFLRRKVQSILDRANLSKRSHAHRKLVNILETFPRDDLFQGTVQDLTRIAVGILQMQDRGLIKLFVRQDLYNRYLSCLLYLPRDNANTDLVRRIQTLLIKAFDGTDVWFTMYFPQSPLARIHYIVRVDSKKPLKYNVNKIEQDIVKIARSWRDVLREKLLNLYGEEKGNELVRRYVDQFPVSYREYFSPTAAIEDIEYFERLRAGRVLEMSFYEPKDKTRGSIKFKVFSSQGTVPLSDALPMLENKGLRVIGEEPYQVRLKDGVSIWINDFIMEYHHRVLLNVEEIREIFQEAFYRVWKGDAESDGFNQLVISAQLNWREISVLRAYAKYFRQTGFTFSLNYIEKALAANPDVARLLVELFVMRFDPEKQVFAHEAAPILEGRIERALDRVVSLDEDRIMRHYLAVINATLRVNYFQKDKEGKNKKYFSFKFDSEGVPGLPQPHPMYEIFVYSPYVEGIHLRSGKVARGGIRWSDRPEDFRTEVLGLVKAQQVKNAVIVPSGAKGGFIVKSDMNGRNRDEVIAEGITCYKTFICGLLDLTDNLVATKVVPPEATVRHDDDDPYLVVAADKGTATFSDIANELSAEYKFWLGDAFASGGSSGYDHKKMGITARGAWVSVERHFKEMGKNPAKDEFTVVGVGDMSGDVFGNGMLLSKKIKLVAAFNHMHIFIDPDPDSAVSYRERKRLFSKKRTTWDDYNRDHISEGGGVYKRSAKFIKLSDEARALLDVEDELVTPNDLIKSILTARVDLFWNGGIGTYVKSRTESHLDVGDRANDAVRINGGELRAKISAEGGNLGFTQLGRVEYELNGGRMNTDFIDNSAGVDCSDSEVNIKILLNDRVAKSHLSVKQRNKLLVDMTDEVADIVLHDNYLQNRAISFAMNRMDNYFNLYTQFMHYLQREGKLNRALEFLPSDETLTERRANGQGFTRSEIAVLLAYSKMLLKEDILSSDLPEDEYFSEHVQYAFPRPLREKYSKSMKKHHLRREIIATQLSNDLVADMGLTLVYQMMRESNATPAEIVKAYVASREIVNVNAFFSDIQKLDYKVDPAVQMNMVVEIVTLVRRNTRWFLRNPLSVDIESIIHHFKKRSEELYELLPSILGGSEYDLVYGCTKKYVDAGVPKALVKRVACLHAMGSSLNIIQAAALHKVPLKEVADVYFSLMDKLGLVWFREQINSYPVHDEWSVLARSAVKADLDWFQRALTANVLSLKVKTKSVNAQIEVWAATCTDAIVRWNKVITDLRSSSAREYTMLSVAMRELGELARTSVSDLNSGIS